MHWLTKTMTKNNRVGKAFFYSFFCALAWVGYYFITHLSNIYFLPLFSSSMCYVKVSMYQGGASNYQGKAIIYQGLISAFQDKVSMCQADIYKGYYLVSNCQGGISKGYFFVSVY